MFGRLLVGAIGAPIAAALLCVAAVMGGAMDTGASSPGTGVTSVAAPAVEDPSDPIPAEMLVLYRAAAPTCPGLPWVVLAGIGRVETDHGRNTAVSSAGAEGPMQFMPATWQEYGVDVHGTGVPDINDPADAVFAAAAMLCANGASTAAGLPGAIYAYNHSDQYVADVLGWAAAYTEEYGP